MLSILLKKVIVWVIIIIVSVFIIFWYLSVSGFIWSSNAVVMQYNVGLIFGETKVTLLGYGFDTDHKYYFTENLISEPGFLDIINIYLNKSKLNNLKVELDSVGIQGGSAYMGNTINMITVMINGEKMNLKEGEEMFEYSLKYGNKPIDELNITMSYKDKHLFSEEQVLEKKLIFHWANEQEFNKIRQEKLYIQAKE